jgi:hypothetical protein
VKYMKIYVLLRYFNYVRLCGSQSSKSYIVQKLCFTLQILFQAVIAFSIYLYMMCYFLSTTWPCDLRTNTETVTNLHIPFVLLINARNVCSQHTDFLKCRDKNRSKFNGNIVMVQVDWKCSYGVYRNPQGTASHNAEHCTSMSCFHS